MGTSGPRVLLTGASGVVGHAIAQHLSGCRLTCIVGNGSMMSVPDAAVVVPGDVSVPQIGLGSDIYARLLGQTDVIIHSAATTEWGLPAEAYRPVNVTGAEHTAAMAVAAGAAVVLLSTAFVPAVDPDNPAPIQDENIVRAYLESKRSAEQIFRTCGQPLSIIRPTNLVGDAETGSSSRKQVVHHVSEWLMRGRLPYFPAHAGNLVDILPVSTVAEAVAGCIRSELFDCDYWLTAGDNALTVAEAVRICVEVGRSRGFRSHDICPVEPSQIPASAMQGQTASSAVLRMLADVSEVIAASGGVLPSSMELLHARFGITMPDLATAYRRSLEFWSLIGSER